MRLRFSNLQLVTNVGGIAGCAEKAHQPFNAGNVAVNMKDLL